MYAVCRLSPPTPIRVLSYDISSTCSFCNRYSRAPAPKIPARLAPSVPGWLKHIRKFWSLGLRQNCKHRPAVKEPVACGAHWQPELELPDMLEPTGNYTALHGPYRSTGSQPTLDTTLPYRT